MHDSHIHLNLAPLFTNIENVISDFKKQSGKYILTQSTDLFDYKENLELAKKYPEIIQVAIGIHPTIFEESTIQKNKTKDIHLVCQEIIGDFEDVFEKNKTKVNAVGETGLDYYQFSTDNTLDEDIKEQLKEIQKISFIKHVELAVKHNLPISIHARDLIGSNECLSDVLRIVAQHGKGLLKGSFHSYTGDLNSLEEILDMGFYIGFNGIITYKSGGNVREILRNVPLERILFETDGPFLPPQSVRENRKLVEKYAQPSDIKEIIQKASEVKNIPYEELEKVTDTSYKELFIL